MERDLKPKGQTACYRPPKPSAAVIEYVIAPITGSETVVIRGSFEGVKTYIRDGISEIKTAGSGRSVEGWRVQGVHRCTHV
jgi:hypothetical protein